MIKAKCKNGKFRITIDGTGRELIYECANIMLDIAGVVKKDNASMEDLLNAMARYAARIYKQRDTEATSNHFDKDRNAPEQANTFEECRNIGGGRK